MTGPIQNCNFFFFMVLHYPKRGKTKTKTNAACIYHSFPWKKKHTSPVEMESFPLVSKIKDEKSDSKKNAIPLWQEIKIEIWFDEKAYTAKRINKDDETREIDRPGGPGSSKLQQCGSIWCWRGRKPQTSRERGRPEGESTQESPNNAGASGG